jgi:hypothetical protein
MRFDGRIFALAKDPDRPEQNQDACRADARGGIAAIADGVSSAIFSAQWANVLVDAVIAAAPEPSDPEGFAAWLGQRRQAWSQRIDASRLGWSQRAKLPRGAFSTLLWVRVGDADGDRPGAFGACRLQGFAIGDSCLFHVRGRELVRSFPLHAASEFDADPLALGSLDLGRDRLMQFTALDELCYPEDLLVLCTDALAQWAMQREEAGTPPDWNAWWDVPEARWQAEIANLRNAGQIRYDDTTLMLLRVRAAAGA